jgi:hypothetical protein
MSGDSESNRGVPHSSLNPASSDNDMIEPLSLDSPRDDLSDTCLDNGCVDEVGRSSASDGM